jgi:hypothetical protein
VTRAPTNLHDPYYEGATMLSGHDFAPFPGFASEPLPAGVQLRRLTSDDAQGVAPPQLESRVLDDWLPQRRVGRVRLQRLIDSLDTQVSLLDERGEIIAVNRTWRLSAAMNGLGNSQLGVGWNYLSLCRTSAASGCSDATQVAHGLEGVMEGAWRSFYYKYDWRGAGQRRVYAMLAWRVVEDGLTYVVVSHELLDSQPE